MKSIYEGYTPITDIPKSYFDKALASLKRITVFRTSQPEFENPRVFKWRTDKVITETYRYVIIDGKYYEQCDTYEHGISYSYIGDTEEDMIAHLIFETVWSFSINCTQANENYAAEQITDKLLAEVEEKYQPYFSRRKEQRHRLKESLKEKGMII